LYRGRPWPRRLCSMGTELPQKKGHNPHQFLAHVYCGQTARRIKVLLDTEVNLGPGDAVLDGVAASPLSPEKRHSAPVFSPCLLWPNSWMDEDATWYRSGPRPRPRCVRWGHSSPPPRLGSCLLWPRSPISATAELLLRVVIKARHVRSPLQKTLIDTIMI